MNIEFYKHEKSKIFEGYIVSIAGAVNQKSFEVWASTEDKAKSIKKGLASGALKTPLKELNLYILMKEAVGNCPPIYKLKN